ncbi:dihydrofolate reductase family protein [Emticicia fontis]
MRKLIFGINTSLDGNVDHTKQANNKEVHKDIHEYFTKLFQQADTLLYGRKTYELMVPFWPDVAKEQSGPTKEINDFANAFDSMSQIIVFSKTLEKVEDGKTKIFRSNLQEEVMKLKQEDGKDILLGGVDLSSQLIESGLVDEFHFVVQPLVAGEGRRLLGSIDLPESLELKLAEAKVFKSGCVALVYAKA